jgi:multiple sugar transport system substrate-binding protein
VVPEGSINFAITKDIVPLFINHKVAMFPGTSAQFGQLQKAGMPQEQWFTVVGPDGWNRGGGWAYGLPVGAAHTEEGRDYALWFVETRNQERLMIRQPARASASNVPPWNTPEYAAIFKAAKWSRLTPITPAWGEISTIVITELQKTLQGTKTPQQGADDMAAQMNTAIQNQ